MLGRILDTFSHGTEKAARFLKQHPWFHRLATYAPIALFSTFFLSISLPWPTGSDAWGSDLDGLLLKKDELVAKFRQVTLSG